VALDGVLRGPALRIAIVCKKRFYESEQCRRGSVEHVLVAWAIGRLEAIRKVASDNVQEIH